MCTVGPGYNGNILYSTLHLTQAQEISLSVWYCMTGTVVDKTFGGFQ